MKTNTKLLTMIVDLGKVTDLTFGGNGRGWEANNRSFGQCVPTTNSHITYIIELGAAKTLTMGAAYDHWEYSWRPRS